MQKILITFDYKNLLIKEYSNWYLLLRAEQITIGSLVLIEKSFKTKYSDISKESFLEFGDIVREVESTLFGLFSYNKINYLMLMMADDEVHYHIVPRYSEDVYFDSVVFKDTGWPKLPNFSKCNVINDITQVKLIEALKNKLAFK